MPEIKIQHVVSYSSQDNNNPAENLLKADGTSKWKCAKAGEKQSSVVLQFEKACVIHSIDIGNDSSAFVEILVGRSSSDKDFQVILVASSFMSPMESRNNTNKYSVRMFGADKLSKTVATEKWDQVKIVCTQPFNKNITYGLSFIKFHSPPESSKESAKLSAASNNDLTNPQKIGAFFFRKDEENDNDVKVGSLFARHKEKQEPPPLTVAAAIRNASNEAQSNYMEKKNNSSFQHSPKSTGNKRKHELSDEENGVEDKKDKKGKLSEQEERTSGRLKDEEERSTHRQKEIVTASSSIKAKSKQINQTDEKKKEKKSVGQDESKPHRDNGNHTSTTPSSSSKSFSSKPQESSKNRQAFHKILEGVVFVLSGFQNPFRGELRDKAIEMGAKYRPDWMDGCTHLVCAFANTPKYSQVKGKGKIVTKHWITDCYKQKTKLHWKKYRLVDNESEEEEEEENNSLKSSSQNLQKKELKVDPDFEPSKHEESQSEEEESEDESEDDTDDEIKRVKEGEFKKKTSDQSEVCVPSSSTFGESTTTHSKEEEAEDDDDDYDVATDVDEESASDGELPELPEFLSKKHFFLYGEIGEKERHDLNRYIIAYNGELEDYMNEKVDFVVTTELWDNNFDDALTNYPQLTFVRPKWLYKCYENNKWVPYQPHIVTP